MDREAIDSALLLLANQVTHARYSEEVPEYLAWVEQTRLKIEVRVQAPEKGDVLDTEVVLARLRRKVDAAKAVSV